MKGGWWEGTRRNDGKRGFFPDNHVKLISHNPNSTSHETPLLGKKFRVQYNYIPANVDELELHVNDIVEVISEIEEGWWEGKLGRTIGVFPSNFVSEITDAELVTEKNSFQYGPDVSKAEVNEKVSKNAVNNGPTLPPKPTHVKEICVALFPYEAKHEDELTLKENDVIWLLSTDLPDKGWWKGQLNGKIGVFPDNFVKVIAINEDSLKLDKPSSAETRNKMSDAVPKLSSYNVAPLRKTLQPENTSNVAKNPVVSKKQSQLTGLMKLPTEKTLPTCIDPSSTLLPETALSIKTSPRESKHDSSGTFNPEKLGVTSSDSISMSEELNTALKIEFAPDECETDSAMSSNIHKINDFKCAIKHEPVSSVFQSNSDQEVDLNSIQRSELLTHPTASRIKAPKRRPPSGINFKDVDDIASMNNEITKFLKGVPSMNDATNIVPNKTKSIPCVQELKLNQAKKILTPQANLKNGFTSTGSNVTFRFQHPVSMYNDDSFDQNVASTYQKTNLIPITNDHNSLIKSNQGSTPRAHETGKFVIASTDDWNALNEKVNNLEEQLERQAEFFQKSINHLKIKLAEEVEHRLEMKNVMEKLMEMVTQV